VTWSLAVGSDSVAATKAVAEALSRVVRSGDTILLVGDLGAGKTVFAQGLAAGLGVSGPVTSPTFALMRQYRCGPGCRVDLLIHADVYRTESIDEVVDLAIGELVEEQAVAVIEWGDMAAPALGDDVLEVTLGPGAEPDARTITLVGKGRWHERSNEVHDALGARSEPVS